jgi:hypothetical protein
MVKFDATGDVWQHQLRELLKLMLEMATSDRAK